MNPAHLLSDYDSTLPYSSEGGDCSIAQLIAYLEENEFKEHSTCSLLKALNLQSLIHKNFSNEDDYHQFLASSAYRFMDALRPNEKKLDKEQLIKRINFHCTQYVSPLNPNSTSPYLNHYRKHKSNNPYSKNNTPMHDACFDLMSQSDERYDFNNVNVLDTTTYLQTKAFDNTPLNLACKTGNSHFAKILINKHKICHVEVNQPDSKGMTPLHWACFYRDNDLIEQLIKAGADIKAKNIYQQTPLDFYQKQIPSNISIKTTSDNYLDRSISDPLLVANVICESNNRLACNRALKENEISPEALLDIIFHMDIIAFNQLQVPAEILVQELENAKDYIQNANGNFDVNLSFKVFNYHHLSDVIHARNDSPCNETLLCALEPQTTCYEFLILILERLVSYILSFLPDPNTTPSMSR